MSDPDQKFSVNTLKALDKYCGDLMGSHDFFGTWLRAFKSMEGKQMREPVSYRCDVCKRVAPYSEDWISAHADPHIKRVDIIYGTVDDEGYQHLCGPDCSCRALSRIMEEWSAK